MFNQLSLLLHCRIKHSSFGVFVCVACMGAPVILNEKLVNGTEALNCIETMQKLLASGMAWLKQALNLFYSKVMHLQVLLFTQLAILTDLDIS